MKSFRNPLAEMNKFLYSVLFLLRPVSYEFSLHSLAEPYVLRYLPRCYTERRSNPSLSGRTGSKQSRKDEVKSTSSKTLTSDNCFSVSLNHVDDSFKDWINNMLKAHDANTSTVWSEKEFGTFNIHQVEIISNTSAFLLTLGKSDDMFHNSSRKSWHIVCVEQSSDKNKISVSSYQELFLLGDDEPEIREVRQVGTGRYVLTLARNGASKNFEVLV